MLAPGEYNRLVAAVEGLEDAMDSAVARREPGTVDFDDYLARRDLWQQETEMENRP
jgi:hypothetical protein